MIVAINIKITSGIILILESSKKIIREDAKRRDKKIESLIILKSLNLFSSSSIFNKLNELHYS